MINVIITSYKEPKSTLQAVKSFLNQDIEENIKKNFRIIVCDPFIEVKEFLKQNIKDKRVDFFLDPGEGKNYALNLLLEKLQNKRDSKEDIFIFSDGDVYVSNNSVGEILKAFEDSDVGCVTGRPIPINPPENKFGYWAQLLYNGIHKTRLKLNKEKEFFQSTGYLFAIRSDIIKEIPLDVPEDAIIPYLIWKKGYRNLYAPEAKVYVKYPTNWDDWTKQRIRTIKAHENINKLFPDMPRTKSFFNEIKEGALFALLQPRTLGEFFWTADLFLARLYIYYKSFKEIKDKKVFDPAWRDQEIKSTNPFDEK